MHISAKLRGCLLADLPNSDTEILTSDLSVAEARTIWLCNSLIKKWAPESDGDADRAALSKFVACNDTCRSFSINPSHIYHDIVINEVKQFFINVWHAGPDTLFTTSRLFEGFGLGPGANVDVKSQDFYTKLWNSSLSRTENSTGEDIRSRDQLYRNYRYAIVENPHWLSAELERRSNWGDAVVAGSSLSFVPKTNAISRTICTEPTLNMLFQKSLGKFLEARLKSLTGVNLSTQPGLNRRLARRGSRWGLFGTIDLASASDSISISLLREILPKEMMEWLMLTRSPNTKLPNGDWLKLEMISSMGNGFTFPLQTLIFSALVLSCYRVMGIKPKRLSSGPMNWAVFGDDIIVRKDAYSFVVSCLQLFGFTVNDGKSFNTGWFRESCGSDYWRGAPIRGVYVTTLKRETHVFSAINRLRRWSLKTGIPLPNTLSWLMSRCRFLPIPEHESDDAGVKVDLDEARPSLRWNKWCQCHEYRALIQIPLSFKIPSSEDEVTRLPGFKFNGPGIMLSLLGGYIEDGRVSVRRNPGEYKVKVVWRKTSNWTFSHDADASQVYRRKSILDRLQHVTGPGA